MNISADGILGTAQKINQKRLSAKTQNTSAPVNEKSDSVQIKTQLSGRLGGIQGELRNAQDSLSQNQVIRDGLNQLATDLRNGGNNRQQILSDVRYNDRPVLADFLGEREITAEFVSARQSENRQMISEDMSAISRLQVETENIFATSLVPNTADVSENLAGSRQNPESISSLNADVVMRLTK